MPLTSCLLLCLSLMDSWDSTGAHTVTQGQWSHTVGHKHIGRGLKQKKTHSRAQIPYIPGTHSSTDQRPPCCNRYTKSKWSCPALGLPLPTKAESAHSGTHHQTDQHTRDGHLWSMPLHRHMSPPPSDVLTGRVWCYHPGVYANTRLAPSHLGHHISFPLL